MFIKWKRDKEMKRAIDFAKRYNNGFSCRRCGERYFDRASFKKCWVCGAGVEDMEGY